MSDHIVITLLKPYQKKGFFQKLQRRKADALYREGSFTHEFIWQDRRFVFSLSKRKMNDMWIFRSVANDVKAYLDQHPTIRSKKKLPVNVWNRKLMNFRGKITATDVDHAYWRIAYQQGVISHKTYTKGLTVQDKALRLAALANMASSKEYRLIVAGKLTKDTVVIKYNPLTHKVYNNIRFQCYAHMTEMVKLLGEDFICYKTDCIYYKDTEQNRKIVQDYLDKNELLWKQLIEVKRPSYEEESSFTGE